MDSNARKEPRRVVFVTRRTSAQVRVTDEEVVQTFPEVLFRAVVAIEVLAVALVWMALLFNAPLEGIAVSVAHTQSRQGAVVFPRAAGDAALFPASCGRRARARVGGDRTDCHSVLQHQRRSRRRLREGSDATAGDFLC